MMMLQLRRRLVSASVTRCATRCTVTSRTWSSSAAQSQPKRKANGGGDAKPAEDEGAQDSDKMNSNNNNSNNNNEDDDVYEVPSFARDPHEIPEDFREQLFYPGRYDENPGKREFDARDDPLRHRSPHETPVDSELYRRTGKDGEWLPRAEETAYNTDRIFHRRQMKELRKQYRAEHEALEARKAEERARKAEEVEEQRRLAAIEREKRLEKRRELKQLREKKNEEDRRVRAEMQVKQDALNEIMRERQRAVQHVKDLYALHSLRVEQRAVQWITDPETQITEETFSDEQQVNLVGWWNYGNQYEHVYDPIELSEMRHRQSRLRNAVLRLRAAYYAEETERLVAEREQKLAELSEEERAQVEKLPIDVVPESDRYLSAGLPRLPNPQDDPAELQQKLEVYYREINDIQEVLDQRDAAVRAQADSQQDQQQYSFHGLGEPVYEVVADHAAEEYHGDGMFRPLMEKSKVVAEHRDYQSQIAEELMQQGDRFYDAERSQQVNDPFNNNQQ